MQTPTIQALTTQPPAATTRQSRLRALAHWAIAAQIIFAALSVIGGLVQDDYSIRRQTISELAAHGANQPWLQSLGFLVYGSGLATLAIGLHLAVRGTRRSKVGPLLLLVAAAAMPVVAAARSDCMRDSVACRAAVQAGEVSTSHNIHDQVSMLLFLGLIFAPSAFARRFRQDDRWRDLRGISIVASAASFVLAVAFVIADTTANGGLVQRVFLVVPAAWMIVVSRRIVRLQSDR